MLLPKKDQPEPVTASPEKVEQREEILETFNYTEAETKEMVTEIVREKFGEKAFIIPLTVDGPSEAELNGETRYFYIYAADSLEDNDSQVRGIYHIDPVTGEIFDNGNGKMEKIR